VRPASPPLRGGTLAPRLKRCARSRRPQRPGSPPARFTGGGQPPELTACAHAQAFGSTRLRRPPPTTLSLDPDVQNRAQKSLDPVAEMCYSVPTMRRIASTPIVRREETEDGTYRWVLEYDEKVMRIEHVEIPLEDVDPDDPGKARLEAAAIIGCHPRQVRVEP